MCSVRRFLFRLPAFLLVPVFLFLSFFTGNAHGEAGKPFLTVSAASFNAVMNDLKAIGNAASNPAFAATVEGPVRFWLGKEMMEALDLDGQTGISVYDLGNNNTGFLFGFPLEDVSVLMDFMTEKNEDLEYTEREDGVIVWNMAFIKSVNGWTFIASDETLLKLLDDVKPAELFGTMNGQTFRYWMDFSRMPEEVRKTFLSIQEGAALGLEKTEDESDEEFEARKRSTEASLAMVKAVWDSMTDVEFGMHVNKETNAIESDIDIQMKPESEWGKLTTDAAKVKPVFSGFTQADGMIRSFSSGINSEITRKSQAANVKVYVDTVRKALTEESELKLDEDFLDEIETLLTQFLSETSKQVENHTGLVVSGTPGNTNAAFAVQIPDVKDVKALFGKSVEIVKKQLGEAFDDKWIQNDVKMENGMTFDVIRIPTDEIIEIAEKEDEEKSPEYIKDSLHKIFGDELVLAVGGAGNLCFTALGNNPLEKIPDCLKNSDSKNLSEMNIDVRKLCLYASSLVEILLDAKNQEIAAKDAKNEKNKASAENKEDTGDTEDIKEAKAEMEDLWEEAASDSQETADADVVRELKKSINFLTILAEITAESEHQEAVFTAQARENRIHVKIELQEGITKIVGMIPSLILMNAL